MARILGEDGGEGQEGGEGEVEEVDLGDRTSSQQQAKQAGGEEPEPLEVVEPEQYALDDSELGLD